MTDNDPFEIDRLMQAMQRSRLVHRRPRENRFQIAQQIAGNYYAEEGAQDRIFVNLLALYCRIVVAKLVANNPRVLMQVWDPQQKPTVNATQQWVNRKIQKLNVADSLQIGVLDALVSMGVLKVHLATPEDAAASGWRVKAGEPIATPIDFDDLVYDHRARTWDNLDYIGHRYRAPLRVLRLINKQAWADEIYGSLDRLYNLEGDERISVISRAMYGDADEYERYTDLWEVYLPKHRVVVTLLDADLAGSFANNTRDNPMGHAKALRIQNWIGPPGGPYHILSFGRVPGNLQPKAPCQDLLDLHLLINRLLRKIARRAENSKRNTFVQGSAMQDADRAVKANDMDVIKIDNPQNMQFNVETGGIGQDLFQLFIALKEMFSWLAGNLDILGGLSPQARTATQDEMLNANASATMSDMQKRVVTWTTSVCSALGWYFHHHPELKMRSTYTVPGLPEFSVPLEVTPDDRRAVPWEELDIKISPYSLQFQTPEQLTQDLIGLVQNVITPMMPLLQAQGVQFDAEKFLQKIAHYKDEPDLDDLLSFADVQLQPPGDGPQTPERPIRPVDTKREYVRRSLGNTPHGRDNALMQALSGMSSDNSQMNGVAR